MSGLDDKERHDTINTIQRRITEDREVAFKAGSEQVSENS